jgi:hypothetical protein
MTRNVGYYICIVYCNKPAPKINARPNGFFKHEVSIVQQISKGYWGFKAAESCCDRRECDRFRVSLKLPDCFDFGVSVKG